MKKKLILSILLVHYVFTIFSQDNSKISFGVSAGTNYSKLYFKNDPYYIKNKDVSYDLGYDFSLIATKRLSQLLGISVEPGFSRTPTGRNSNKHSSI
jgi:hypothetical protein